jgi:biotin transport system substrate-specific component
LPASLAGLVLTLASLASRRSRRIVRPIASPEETPAMARARPVPPTFVDALWPAVGKSRALRAVLLALVGSALLTVSAKVQVPFYPVPMTLQTLVVLLLGLALGWRLAFATVLLYLAQGAVGLPVFAGTPEKGIGLAYLLGPTGGYLIGFAFAAAVAGWIAGHRRDLLALVAAVLAGTATIYVFGLPWLATLVGVQQAVVLGLVPFLLGDLVKAALAVALGIAGGELVRRLQS